MALRLSLSAGRLCVFYGRSLASISQALARGFASDENSSSNNNNDINNNNNSGGSSNSAENGEDDTSEPIALHRRGSYSCDILLKPDHRAPLPGRVGVAPGRDRPVAGRKLLSTPLAPPVRRGAELIAELLEDRHTSALVTYLSPLADQLSRGGVSRPTAGGHTVGETTAAGGGREEEQVLQISAHDCPDLLKREFSPLFTERDISSGDLTVLVVNQRTTHDSVLWSEPMEQERAELATQFLSVARDVTLRLRRLGFWADLIDPRSGRPHLSAFLPIQRAAAPPTSSAPPSSSPPAAGAGAVAGSDVLLETDERMALLGFHIEDLGCCRVVRHADWGSHVFIGCMFTNAPLSDARLTNLLKMYDHLPSTAPPSTAAAAPSTAAPSTPSTAAAAAVLSDDE